MADPTPGTPLTLAAAFHEAMALRGWADGGTHSIGEGLCQNIAALVAMDDNLRVALGDELDAARRERVDPDLRARIEARRPAYDPSSAGAYEHGIEDAYRAVLAILDAATEAPRPPERAPEHECRCDGTPWCVPHLARSDARGDAFLDCADHDHVEPRIHDFIPAAPDEDHGPTFKDRDRMHGR